MMPAAVTGSQILQYAVSTFSGLPYTWGNNDCSGIVQKTFANFGISLPRTSSQQWNTGVPVDQSQLQPGDLVFFNPGTAGAPPGEPGHVGIYAGGGMVFSAYNTARGILTMPLSQVGQYMGARREVGAAGNGTGVAAGLAGGLNAVPISSGDPTAQTVATGSDSTCAFAIGTKNKILIFHVNFSVCILSKHEARAIIGALMLAGAGVVTLVGVAVVMKYALDSVQAHDAINAIPGVKPMTKAVANTGDKLPTTGNNADRGNTPAPKRGKSEAKTERELRRAKARGQYLELK